jgi:hypothetical protein
MTYFFLSRLSRPPRYSRLLPVVFSSDETYNCVKVYVGAGHMSEAEFSREKENGFVRFFSFFGRPAMDLVNNLGAMAIFFGLSFIKIFHRKQFREIIVQVFYIGSKSTGIVVLVALFTGMVLGLQLFYTLVKFGSKVFSGLLLP